MKIIKTLFVLFLLFSYSSCTKKDYPDDIPQWVVDKIQERKKLHQCGTYHSPVIMEYSNPTSQTKVYGFVGRYYKNPTSNILFPKTIYYDYNENILCENEGDDFSAIGICGGISTKEYTESRHIWQCTY